MAADGTWEKILRAILAAADAAGRIDWSVVSVDSTVCRAHQHAAGARHRSARVPGQRRRPAEHRSDEAVGRSRGGLTTKIHLASDGNRRPLSVLITPGQWGDALQLITVLDRICVPLPAGGRPRMRPDHVCGDKAYSSHRNHADRCTSGTTWAKPPRSASTGTVVACAPCQNGDERAEEAEAAASSPWPTGHRFAERTRAKHATIHALLDAGHSKRSVARQLGMTLNAILRFSRATTPEELFTGQWQSRATKLDAYKPYLAQRCRKGAPTPGSCGRRSGSRATRTATETSGTT